MSPNDSFASNDFCVQKPSFLFTNKLTILSIYVTLVNKTILQTNFLVYKL